MLTWTAKAPGDVYRYTWSPALAEGDSVSTYAVSVSGAVIDSDALEDGSVVVVVSGGTAGQTAAFSFSAVTDAGETLTETIYLPVCATTTTATTARDVVAFALRKIFGVGEDAEAASAEDALERLADMLEAWRMVGADIGAPRPLTLNSVVYCPDGFLAAIKNNLIVQVADLYDMQVSPVVALNARQGLSLVKNANIPADRTLAEYF